MNVRLTQDQKIQLNDPNGVYKIMQQILMRENKFGRNQEHFWVIGLDNQNKILFIELVGLGAVNRVNANPPDVFRMGIYKLAVKMILVHNHPSGRLEASEADIDMTDRMIKVGDIVKIEVLDHLIISETGFLSMIDQGIFDKLKKNGRYQVIDRDLAEYKEMKLEIELELAEKKKSLEIAKVLKKQGVDVEIIKKSTGLTKWEIKKL